MSFDFAALALSDIQPLLAVKTEIVAAGSRRKKGGRHSPGNDGWVSLPGGQELRLARSLPFTVWEGAILEPYGNALSDLEGVPEVVARSAAADVLLRAIAVQLGGNQSRVVEDAIRFLLRSSATTYEGQAVAINLALDLSAAGDVHSFASLSEYQDQDWHAVLGGGVNTALLVNAAGAVVEHIDVQERTAAKLETSDEMWPDALRYLGNWTKADRRLALSLTRTGEILIQQEGILRYIYRFGKWRALPLTNALANGWTHGARFTPKLKESVLASAIDASLGHHGACIAVVSRAQMAAFNAAEPVKRPDYWVGSARASLFGSATRFGDLTRRQRLELLSMDGATVLDHLGGIVASGAIVRVPGGSTGGGRLAATLELARYGAALKVSQDGPIRLYGLDDTGAVVQKASLA